MKKYLIINILYLKKYIFKFLNLFTSLIQLFSFLYYLLYKFLKTGLNYYKKLKKNLLVKYFKKILIFNKKMFNYFNFILYIF